MHMVWPGFQSEMYGPLDVPGLLAGADLWEGPEWHPPPFGWTRLPAQLQEIDEWLAELLTRIEYDYVVFVSDHGIFAISGTGVVAGYQGEATVLDVAPTLAYALGLPVADDLPGRLVSEAFTLGHFIAKPVKRVATG